ncbi:hypothetical protein DSO57_1016745 [Entomophthora muscae]|uniref:Uncharacterized protein n=1 Tax=Entomophthora muscae TaxID=34485 RepID=A0ACC2TRQ9_9FUNG|nr:hypothetical protein DSO57_1016745 [Entomophthora muscae]
MKLLYPKWQLPGGGTIPIGIVFTITCQGICLELALLPTRKYCPVAVKISPSGYFLAQDWNSNPDPENLQATSPKDQGVAHPRILGVKPLQAEAKSDYPKDKASQTREITAPKEGLIKAPNGGKEIPTISFMSLKSTLVVNQEPSPEEVTGLWPNLMTTPLEQDNQVANYRSLTDERSPKPSAISLLS